MSIKPVAEWTDENGVRKTLDQRGEVWTHLHDIAKWLCSIDPDHCKARGATDRVRAFQAEAPLLSEAERYRRAILLIESFGARLPEEYRTMRHSLREVTP